MEFEITLGAAFAAGVVLHLSLFRLGEWDSWAAWFLRAPFVLLAIISVDLTLLRPTESILKSLKYAVQLDGSLLVGIFASMLVYRAFFHRLRFFPGPFAARLSGLYMTKLVMKRLQPYHEVKKLHEQHGDFVRVGPMQLSITDPTAFRDIYANSSPCEKGPLYSFEHPAQSVIEIRSRKQHGPKRKLWDRAFTTQALNNYEERVGRYTEQLLMRIEEHEGVEFDITRWCTFYSFDVMGELAFGTSFKQLENNIEHYVLQVSQQATYILGMFLHQPWIMPLLKTTPILNWGFLKFQKWSCEQIQNRLVDEPKVPDIFHWISSEYRQNPSPSLQDELSLIAEIRLIVTAGSDTTAMTLTGIFYHLAQAPEARARLRSEIDELVAQDHQALTKNASLAKLGYLQACIDESLRLLPVIPSGMPRMTPPQGAQIGTRWVPGDIGITVPSRIICRDPRCFVRPDEFIPERWTTRPELVLDASVYAPFSIGRASCAGKQLALMEIRRALALALHRYDFSLAPDQRVDAFELGLRDLFVAAAPAFNLVFRKRETLSCSGG